MSVQVVRTGCAALLVIRGTDGVREIPIDLPTADALEALAAEFGPVDVVEGDE